MKSKFLGRVALAALAGVMAFGMTGCDWKAGGPRDGGGDIGRNDPGPWPGWGGGWGRPGRDWGHGHDRGDRGDRGRGPDRGDHGRGPGRGDRGRGPERGNPGRGPERGRDGGRRLEAASRTASLKSLKIMSLDEAATGKMFDGSR